MWSSLKNYSDAALLFVRAALGLILLKLHAWPKLLAAFSIWINHSQHHAFWNGVFITIFAVVETLACVLLVLGRWTRPACLVLGLFVVLAIPGGFHHFALVPAEKDLELILLFVSLFFVGPGRFSFDKA